MMKRAISILGAAALVVALGFSVQSCTQETEPGTDTTTGNVPTMVGANSMSASSIGVNWHRDTNDVTADTVVVTASGTAISSTVVAAPASTAVITGLALNTIYTISVNSAAGPCAQPVQWATAIRTESVRIYETADNNPNEYSGLVLNGNDIQAGDNAVAISVSASSPNGHSADLVLASDLDNPTSYLTIVAPSVTSLSGLDMGKNTRFSQETKILGGMDAIFYTGGLQSTIATTTADTINSIELDSTGNQSPLVFNVLTADGHFARVEVMPQPDNGGRYYGGVAGQNYIDLKISYQPLANTGYADRPMPLMRNVAPIRWRSSSK